jgi:hypothetical protein
MTELRNAHMERLALATLADFDTTSSLRLREKRRNRRFQRQSWLDTIENRSEMNGFVIKRWDRLKRHVVHHKRKLLRQNNAQWHDDNINDAGDEDLDEELIVDTGETSVDLAEGYTDDLEDWELLPQAHPKRAVEYMRNNFREAKHFLNDISHVAFFLLPPFDQMFMPSSVKAIETFVWLDFFKCDQRLYFCFRENSSDPKYLDLIAFDCGHKMYWFRPALRIDGTSDLSKWSLDTEPEERVMYFWRMYRARNEVKKKFWYGVDPFLHDPHFQQKFDYRHFYRFKGSLKRFEKTRKRYHVLLGLPPPIFDDYTPYIPLDILEKVCKSR